MHFFYHQNHKIHDKFKPGKQLALYAFMTHVHTLSLVLPYLHLPFLVLFPSHCTVLMDICFHIYYF